MKKKNSPGMRINEISALGASVTTRELEINLRDAALRHASKLFTEALSGLHETRPECLNCGNIMVNKGKRVKQITSLLGEGSITRNYYECEECHSHAIPKDRILGIENTSLTPGVVYAASKLSGCDSFRSSSEGLKERAVRDRCNEQRGRKAHIINRRKDRSVQQTKIRRSVRLYSCGNSCTGNTHSHHVHRV
jgi:hypothetical protein